MLTPEGMNLGLLIRSKIAVRFEQCLLSCDCRLPVAEPVMRHRRRDPAPQIDRFRFGQRQRFVEPVFVYCNQGKKIISEVH